MLGVRLIRGNKTPEVSKLSNRNASGALAAEVTS